MKQAKWKQADKLKQVSKFWYKKGYILNTNMEVTKCL